jgi:hypothetical protein
MAHTQMSTTLSIPSPQRPRLSKSNAKNLREFDRDNVLPEKLMEYLKSSDWSHWDPTLFAIQRLMIDPFRYSGGVYYLGYMGDHLLVMRMMPISLFTVEDQELIVEIKKVGYTLARQTSADDSNCNPKTDLLWFQPLGE